MITNTAGDFWPVITVKYFGIQISDIYKQTLLEYVYKTKIHVHVYNIPISYSRQLLTCLDVSKIVRLVLVQKWYSYKMKEW